MAWVTLGLSHSVNSYTSVVEFYKYTLTWYLMLKKICTQPIALYLQEEKPEKGGRQDIKMIVYYARTY